jgi:O-antigen/teichoic acid export membrane protein
MRREFIINLALLIFLNLLVKPIYIFGIDRGVQNAVGAEAYGLYFALFNFAFLFQIFNDFGIQYFNNRSISQHRQLLVKYFPPMLMLKLVLGGLYAVVVIGLALLSGYSWEVLPLLGGLILLFIANSLVLYLRSNLSGLGLYRTDSLLSALDRLLLIGVVGFLLWVQPGPDQFRLEWFVAAQVITMSLTALIAFLLVWKQLPSFHLKIRKAFLIHLLRQSYPYALAVFLMTLYTRVDAVMLERLLSKGEYEAGVYASAYRLLDAANVLGFLFAGLLLPMFSRLLKTGEGVTDLFRLGLKLILTFAIPVSLAVFFFREPIAFSLYEEASADWGTVLGLLMLTFMVVSAINVTGPLLTANGNLRVMNYLFVIGIGLNVVLNLWWIPTLGAQGAAQATLLTQGGVLVGQLALIKKVMGETPGIRIGLQLVGMLVLTALLGYFLSSWEQLAWFWRFTLIILGGGSSALWLGILRPSDLRKLLARV